MDSLEKKVYVFLGMGEDSSGNSAELNVNGSLDDDVSENTNPLLHQYHTAHTTSYWESQEALLQETLERYNLIGWKLRGEVKKMLEVVKGSQFCSCSMKPNTALAFACSHCLRKAMVAMLSHAGYKATLRISKWEHTKKFPGGSHEYIEVMMGSMQSTRTKKQTPFLVELELRDQFQMGRASEDYKKLVSLLPEFFVGQPEYLTGIIRVMCSAAKRSMKEKNIHMGPWRKSSFMQMKWSTSASTSLLHFNNNWTLPSFPLSQQIQPNCLAISEPPFVVVS